MGRKSTLAGQQQRIERLNNPSVSAYAEPAPLSGAPRKKEMAVPLRLLRAERYIPLSLASPEGEVPSDSEAEGSVLAHEI